MPLFDAPAPGNANFANYAVHPDGRFPMRKPEDRRVLPVTVAIDWQKTVSRPEAQ